MNLLLCLPWPYKKKRQAKYQTFLIMRLVIFLLIISCFKVTASVAQQVSLEMKDAPVEKVFEEIKKQSGYSFFYKDEVIQKAGKLTISIKNSSIEAALKQCFKTLPLTYEIVGKTIVVKAKLPDKVEKIGALQKDGVTIKGRVSDSTGVPLPGAVIRVKETTKVALTQADGTFEITNVPENSILIFSMVGFVTREFPVANTKDGNLDIILKISFGNVEGVIIVNTGYQQIPKERSTGSFALVSNELFNRQVSTDVVSRLKSVAPSLLFDERSGVTKLNIRGQSTIFANSQPLIVVDNFPIDGDINSINPNDVESITILRDAAAASIWGVRAGNGVIVITTRKGGYDRTPQVSINSNLTIGKKPDLYYTPAMSPSDFIDLETNLFNLGRYNDQLNNTQNMPAVSPVVDILERQKKGLISADVASAMIQSLRAYDLRNDLSDYFYQKSINQQYALNFNGGGKKYSYYFSAGYDHNASNRVGNEYQRINLNANNTYKPFDNVEIGVNLIHAQSNVVSDNTIDNIRMSSAQNIYPYARLVGDNGEALAIVKDYRSSFVQGVTANGYLDWQYRPKEELNLSDNKSKTLSTRVNSFLKYNLLDGFTVELRYQYERQAFNSHNLQSSDTYYTRDIINSYTTTTGGPLVRNIPFGGIITTQDQSLESNNGRFQLNYNKTWGDHELNVLSGFEARQLKTEGYGGKYYGYQDATGATTNVNYTASFLLYPRGTGGSIPAPGAISATVDRYRSYFFNGAYTYKGKYTASVSARRDESNLFGVSANQKGVPLWSAGLSWNLTKESFIKLPFDLFKFRTSYGYNGNFDNTVTALTTARYSGNYVFTQQPYATLATPPNANLSWERIGIVNIGLDVTSLGSRVSGSIDVYFKKGKDLLGFGNLNATTGFTSYKGNIAGSKGKGIDLQLNTVNLNGNFQWRSNLLLSYVSDKVTSYEQKPNVSDLFIDYSAINGGNPIPVVGKPLYGIYSYRWAGLSASNGDPMGYLNGQPSSNYSAIQLLPMDSESIIYHGRATPPIFGAVRNTFAYKAVELSFNISYKFGYYFRRTSINYGGLVNSYNTHSDYGLRWQTPGDEMTTYVPSFVYPINSARDLFYSRSEVLVERADHIRLQDIQVSYSLSKRLLARLPFSNFQFYAYANNVGILWRANKEHIDPDYGNFLPQPRSIAFGIRTNFK